MYVAFIVCIVCVLVLPMAQETIKNAYFHDVHLQQMTTGLIHCLPDPTIPFHQTKFPGHVPGIGHITPKIKWGQHRRTQDFIMEGLHVVGAGPGSLGT